MEITKEESKKLAKAFNKTIRGEGVVYSPSLVTYLVVIIGGEGFLDPYSTRIYNREEVGEVKGLE